MYQIKPEIRTVFRATSIFAAVFAVLFAAIAFAAPYLIESRRIEESLVRNLSAWSGGEVEIKGPIRVSSLIALTIEAKNIRITKPERLDPVQNFSASSIRAVVDFAALLQGKLEFKKVIVSSAKIVLKRDLAAKLNIEKFGTGVLMMPMSFADKNPFDDLILKWPVISYADKPRRPYRSLQLSQLRLGRSGSGATVLGGRFRKNEHLTQFSLRYVRKPSGNFPISAKVKSGGIVLSLAGEADVGAKSVSGEMSFAMSSAETLSAHLKGVMGLGHSGGDLAAAGTISWSPERLALDNAKLRFGTSTATGSLVLTLQNRKLLEGTLAYDVLDASVLVPKTFISSDKVPPDAILNEGFKFKLLSEFNLDLRLSADRVVAGPFSGGPFALSLTSQNGRVSADLAELGLFGGNISGRFGYDSASQETLLKFAAKNVDGNQMSQAMTLPLTVTGPADFTLNLVKSGAETPYNLNHAEGRFVVHMPSGGAVGGEMLKRFWMTLADQDWASTLSRGNFPVSQLTIDGKLGGGMLALKLDGWHNKRHLTGSISAMLEGGGLNGTLTLSGQGGMPNVSAEPAGKKEDQPTTLILSGTVAKANIFVASRANLQN